MRAPFPVAALLLGSLVAMVCVGCGPATYAAAADDEVTRVLAVASAQHLDDRVSRVLMPRPAAPAKPPAVSSDAKPGVRPDTDPAGATTDGPANVPASRAPGPAPPATPLAVDLATALRLAVRGNRDLQFQREALFRQGLAVTAARFDFGPQLGQTIAALWGGRESAADNLAASTALGVTQILPTGGQLALDGGAGFDRPRGGPDAWATNATVRLRQPLLRGAGYVVSHEPLTAVERELIYALRDFELFRQRLAIDIADEFFRLVSDRQTLANQERLWQDAAYDRKKAEVLYSVDRNDQQQVFRARRREVETENALIDGRANYKRALDAFKIRLGLPTASELAIADVEPDYLPIDIDDGSAIAAALHNRLDLHTLNDRVADAARQVRNAGNNLLPDLDLEASYGVAGSGAQLDRASPDDDVATVGITMRLPLQRLRERNVHRNTMIVQAQAQRAYELARDQIELEVRDQLRQLRSIEQRIVLQGEQIDQERKAVAVIQKRYESGNADNRDLLEARQGLIDVQNALIRLKVDHFVRRLELLRGLGVLFISAEGMWS